MRKFSLLLSLYYHSFQSNVHCHSIQLQNNLLSIRGGGGKQSTLLPEPLSLHKSSTISTQTVLRAGGHEEKEDHLMDPFTAVANILADLCPHGMLPLAFGMSAFGGTGACISVIIVIIFGLLSWYSLLSFGRAADFIFPSPIDETALAKEEELSESIATVWKKTISSSTSWIPDVGCALLTIGCCLFYSAFIGDLFNALVSGMRLPASLSFLKKRSSILLLLHLFPILPLCLLKDLSALMYSSMAGLLGIVYTVFFVGKRMVDKSYAQGGKFFELMSVTPHLQPKEQSGFPGKQEGVGVGKFLFDMPLFHVGNGILTLMNMSCVAFACHYNAVKYFMELKDRRIGSFAKVMGAGISGTGLVFISMMILGYGTFGANSQALLLNNYHKSEDIMATAARAFTGLAILSGYPLMFAGLKSAMFSLTKLDASFPTDIQAKKRNGSKQNLLSVMMLTLISIGACFVTEHELATVIGIVGSIFGSAVIYIFPALINNSVIRSGQVKKFFYGELLFNKFLILFGLGFAVLGSWITLSSEGGH